MNKYGGWAWLPFLAILGTRTALDFWWRFTEEQWAYLTEL
jgi:hypothetical protein